MLVMKYRVVFPDPVDKIVDAEVPLDTPTKERYDSLYRARIFLNIDREYTIGSMWKKDSGITFEKIGGPYSVDEPKCVEVVVEVREVVTSGS